MIDSPTTFIVGAGGSVPHGLPTGAGMRSGAGSLNSQSHLYQYINTVLFRRDNAFKVDVLNKFFRDLNEHTSESIDEYLEKRRLEPFASIGRIVIATLMGSALQSARSEPGESQDWLLHIFRRMARGIDTFPEFVEKNRCKFITFNFDSIIEDRLLGFLKVTYGFKAVTSNPFSVIHVHGRLDRPPSEPMEYDGGSRTRNENWINWIERASQQINVTADTVSREALLEARNAVESAAVICFLGFGYNRTNLERLDMPNTLNKFRPRLFGSAVAMTKASRDAVEHWIPGLELARQAENCVKTLEELPVIREI